MGQTAIERKMSVKIKEAVDEEKEICLFAKLDEDSTRLFDENRR